MLTWPPILYPSALRILCTSVLSRPHSVLASPAPPALSFVLLPLLSVPPLLSFFNGVPLQLAHISIVPLPFSLQSLIKSHPSHLDLFGCDRFPHPSDTVTWLLLLWPMGSGPCPLSRFDLFEPFAFAECRR